MKTRNAHTDWLASADRRASDAPAARGPRATGAASATATPSDGLTRRERRVRDLLLRELKKSSDFKNLSYLEIQHLQKKLSVGFIDSELAKMRKQYRHSKWLWLAYVVLFGSQAVLYLLEGTGFALGMAIVLLPMGGLGPFFTRRAIRRKIFIYEALRELAGADEAGVTLEQAVQEADALISRIVEREMEAETLLPPRTVGRIRSN